MTPRAFSVSQLAERWFCSKAHIYNMIRIGFLSAFRLGGSLRISSEEVARVENAPVKGVGNGHARFTNPWDRP